MRAQGKKGFLSFLDAILFLKKECWVKVDENAPGILISLFPVWLMGMRIFLFSLSGFGAVFGVFILGSVYCEVTKLVVWCRR